jgi:hypothetical protein
VEPPTATSTWAHAAVANDGHNAVDVRIVNRPLSVRELMTAKRGR